jgi:hypothetical protein
MSAREFQKHMRKLLEEFGNTRLGNAANLAFTSMRDQSAYGQLLMADRR